MEIKFKDVSFSYGKNTDSRKTVLNNLSLEILSGKTTSIIGRSGCGKTTLVELINALHIPDDGVIKVGKFKISSTMKKKIKNINDLRVNVGLVFQFPEDQFFNMTVKDEISFGMKYFDFKDDEINSKVIDSLKLVKLDESYLNRNPFTLSNGEKRKVAIASILAYNPTIIIFDEPTVGLDCISKKNFISMIRELKLKKNKTIIVISHDIDLIHSISDDILILDNGEIVMQGTKYEIFKREEELNKLGIRVPKLMEFSNKVLREKNIKIGYRDDINDLIKDIYRYVR